MLNGVRSTQDLPSLWLGVLKGVEKAVLGVATTALFGVIPSKSDWLMGVFMPPFRGVSTFCKARMF